MLNLRSDVDRDCLSLIAALIDLPGGSAPEQPLPDTGPQCLVDLGDTIPGEDGFLDVIVNANEPFSFIATGVDDDPADVLTLTSSGVPSGASLTPGDGAMGPSPLATVYDWTPTDDDAASLHVVEVTFTDSEGESSSCSIEITVNRGPVCVVAGAPAITFQCTSPDGAFVTLDGSSSSDPDGDDLTFAWAISNDSVSSSSTDQAVLEGLFPVGVTMATLSVADGRGAVASCDVLVTVEGFTPAGVLCTTSTAMLWPPKGQLVDVEIYILATDECADPDVVFPIIVTVSSDEPDASLKGSGDENGQDGYSSPVAVNAVWTGNPGEFTATIQLRAERDGDGDGRKYTIDVIASDGTLSEATTSCCIVVPHSRRGAKK